MDTNIDNLKILIDQIKTIGFWGRLFRWKRIREKLIDAAGDLQKLVSTNDYLKEQLANLEATNSNLHKDVGQGNENLVRNDLEIQRLNALIQACNDKNLIFERDLSSKNTLSENQREKINELEVNGRILGENIRHITTENVRLSGEVSSNSETITNLSNRKSELENEISVLKTELNRNKDDSESIKKQNMELLKDEEFRKKEHSNAVSSLTEIRVQIQNDRTKDLDEKNRIELERIKKLKETWSCHQENVRNVIKTITSKHTIEYVEKVPFKGEPDNTIKICDEFLIFDAKSPGSDDLSNFPNYLKDQAEKARKYIKEEGVRKDIYFVVPSNTLEKIQQFVARLGDYNIYIVSLDCLEPLILSLKKLEEYEFAEQLSPEERENICRVLGKFAHLTKRRIQIDSFFIKQFIELAYKCESDLPTDILEHVLEFEKAEKLNPPTERRTKQINLKELEKDATKLRNETSSKGIVLVGDSFSAELNKLPLYEDGSDSDKG